jgi:hypothetical protein
MAGGLERFKLSSPGARRILRSGGVQSDLVRRAGRVWQAADDQLRSLEGPYPTLRTEATTGPGRAGVTITGVPLPLEESRRILGGAIDAAG